MFISFSMEHVQEYFRHQFARFTLDIFDQCSLPEKIGVDE